MKSNSGRYWYIALLLAATLVVAFLSQRPINRVHVTRQTDQQPTTKLVDSTSRNICCTERHRADGSGCNTAERSGTNHRHQRSALCNTAGGEQHRTNR